MYSRDLVVLGGHLVDELLPLVGLLGQVGQRHLDVEHLLDPVQQRERRLRVRRLRHVVRDRRPERDRRDAGPHAGVLQDADDARSAPRTGTVSRPHRAAEATS